MSAGFIIDEENQLRVVRNNDFPPQPAAIKLVAKIISYIFHPVFVPMYIVLFMVYVHPWIFAGFSGEDKIKTVIMTANQIRPLIRFLNKKDDFDSSWGSIV